jgi:hypothetical protein
MALKAGKPAKAVLVARIRMIVVAVIVPKYSKPRFPNAVRASWEMTVSTSEGTAPITPSR